MGHRRGLLVVLLVVLALVLVPGVLAQGDGDGPGVVPPPVSEVEQGIGLLEYLIGVSLVVTIIIDQLKPLIFMPLAERFGDRQALLAVYASRTGLGVVAVVVYGGAGVMIDYVPLLATVPESVVVVTGGLLVAGGTEILHPLVDILYVLRDRIRPGEVDVSLSFAEAGPGEGVRG